MTRLQAEYELLRFTLPVDLEELFTAELWSLGALGFEITEAEPGQLRLDAYFPSPLPTAAEIYEFAPWTRRGVLQTGSERFADRDWLASYRQTAKPFDVGHRLRIDPRDLSEENKAADDGSRVTLKIPAQTAFGTGSHESTRLVLEWLEQLDLTGLEVLDVGTGSGILSFAAERLGARQTVSFDIDAPSVCIAGGNARLNAVTPWLFAGSIAAIRLKRRFDLALVNILPENFASRAAPKGHKSNLERLAAMMKLSGRLISSGNLVERRSELLAQWQDHGFVLEAERQRDEWIAFLLALTDR